MKDNDMIRCPQCGNIITDRMMIRCIRCNQLLLLPCQGSCKSCYRKKLHCKNIAEKELK